MSSNFATDESSQNPYQAPQTPELFDPSAQNQPELTPVVLESGVALWVSSPTTLPPTCVLCNQPVDPLSYQTRQLSYFKPWLYLLLCIPPLFFFVQVTERKRCEVTYGYCETHQRRRIWKNVVCILIYLLSISWICRVLFVVLSEGNYTTFQEFLANLLPSYSFIPTVILFVVSCFFFITQHRLKVCDYVAGQFDLRGFGREFLDANAPRDSAEH